MSMKYTKEDLDRIRQEWEFQTQDFHHTSFITESEASRLIRSRRRPQSQQKRVACACFLLAVLAIAGFFVLLLVKAWMSASLFATLVYALLLLGTLCVFATTAHELFLLLMMHRHRFQLSQMDVYFIRYQRLLDRRSRWCGLVLNNPKNLNISRPDSRPRIAFTMVCLAVFIGVAAWIAIGNRHSDDELLLSNNHYSQSEENPMRVSSSSDVATAIATTQASSAPVAGKETSPCDAVINPSVPKDRMVPSSEPLAEVSIESPHSGEYAMNEISHFDDVDHLGVHADIQVTCNVGECSAERYCAMLHEDLLDR